MKFSSPSALFALSFLFSHSCASPLPYTVHGASETNPTGVGTSQYQSSDPSYTSSYATSKYTPPSPYAIGSASTTHQYGPTDPNSEVPTGSVQIQRSLKERNLDNNDHAAAIIFETLAGVTLAGLATKFVGIPLYKRAQAYRQRKAENKPTPGSDSDARDLSPEEANTARSIAEEAKPGLRAYVRNTARQVTSSVAKLFNRPMNNRPDVKQLQARVTEATKNFDSAELEVDIAQRRLTASEQREKKAKADYNRFATDHRADPAIVRDAQKEWQDAVRARSDARTLLAYNQNKFDAATAALSRATVDLEALASEEGARRAGSQPGDSQRNDDTVSTKGKDTEKHETSDPKEKDAVKADTGKKGNDGQSIKIEGIPAASVDEVVEKVAQNNQNKAETFAEVTRGGKA